MKVCQGSWRKGGIYTVVAKRFKKSGALKKFIISEMLIELYLCGVGTTYPVWYRVNFGQRIKARDPHTM